MRKVFVVMGVQKIKAEEEKPKWQGSGGFLCRVFGQVLNKFG